MQVYKAVRQQFSPDPSLLAKMETFREMVNDCLRIGLDSGVSTFESLKPLCYPRLLQYNIESSYRTSAIFEAGRVLEKFRTESQTGHPGRPYCRKAFLSASMGVWVDKNDLVLPDRTKVRLNPHTMSVLSQPGVRANSVTITPYNLGVCYCREAPKVGILGAVALDVNLDNVTAADSEGGSTVYDLSPSVKVHERYRRVTSGFRRHDFRVRGALLRKYGTLEKDAKMALLHGVSSVVVQSALRRRQAIIMEDLRGLKEVFRREGGKSAGYMSKMNSWPFGRLRTQVFYKATWGGLPVVWLDPPGTSNECSSCGGGMRESPESHPMVKCRACGLEIDRDLNAARVILGKGMERLGLRSGPVGPTGEAMVGTGGREAASDAKVDVGQSFGQPE